MLWEKLTPKQKKVCELLCCGYGYEGTKNELGMSKRTLKMHMYNISMRLGVHSPNMHVHVSIVYCLLRELQETNPAKAREYADKFSERTKDQRTMAELSSFKYSHRVFSKSYRSRGSVGL